MLLLFLLALAVPQQEGVRALADADLRVAEIGERLARGSAGLCPGQRRGAGFVLQDAAEYAPALRAAARDALMVGDWPTIIGVARGSAADKAGLRRGDMLVAIGSQELMSGQEERASYARVEQAEKLISAALVNGPIELRIRRAGVDLNIRLVPQPGCASRFQMLPGPKLNATADGTYVQVSGALLDFVRTDDELSLILAHEFAHNILGHQSALDAAGVSRGLFAGFGKNRQRIRDTEIAADRYALYLMARAGFDITVAPQFWERLGRHVDAGIFSDGTHPGGKHRAELARQEIARILAQQRLGQVPTP